MFALRVHHFANGHDTPAVQRLRCSPHTVFTATSTESRGVSVVHVGGRRRVFVQLLATAVDPGVDVVEVPDLPMVRIATGSGKSWWAVSCANEQVAGRAPADPIVGDPRESAA